MAASGDRFEGSLGNQEIGTVVNAVAVPFEVFWLPIVFVGGMLGQECVVLSYWRAVFGRFFTAIRFPRFVRSELKLCGCTREQDAARLRRVAQVN